MVSDAEVLKQRRLTEREFPLFDYPFTYKLIHEIEGINILVHLDNQGR